MRVLRILAAFALLGASAASAQNQTQGPGAFAQGFRQAIKDTFGGATVNGAGATDGQALVYQASTNKWIPGTISAGVASSRAINTTTPLTGGGDLSADRTITFTTQVMNTALMGPTSGADAAPAFRALVAGDIPSLAASKITTGQLLVARGGTGVDASGAANGQLLIGNGTGFTLASITAGSNITITPGAGTLQISATSSAFTGGTLSSQINWTTGLGAIDHVFGPTDTRLTLASAPERDVYIRAGAGTGTNQSGSVLIYSAAPSNANGNTVQIQGGLGGGANKFGGNLNIRGGEATGTGEGGSVLVQSTAPGGSSSNYNSVITIATFRAGGAATGATLALTPGTTTSSSGPATDFDIAHTWNSSGTTFKGINMAITATAAAAPSRLIDLSVASSSVFNIKTDGTTNAGAAASDSFLTDASIVGLEWAANSTNPAIVSTFYNTSSYPLVVNARARGTAASPSAVQTSDVLGLFAFAGYHSNGGWGTQASMNGYASENWSNTQRGSYIAFTTTPTGSTSGGVRWAIQPAGHWIGTSALVNGWVASTTDPSGSIDTGWSRISAGVFGAGTGTQGSVAGTVRATTFNATTFSATDGAATAATFRGADGSASAGGAATARGGAGAGTNQDGGLLTLAAGTTTGTSVVSRIIFSTSPASGSGTGVNATVNRWAVMSPGHLIGTSALMHGWTGSTTDPTASVTTNLNQPASGELAVGTSTANASGYMRANGFTFGSGAVTAAGCLTWSTGFGGVTHIQGPSDNQLFIASGGSQALLLTGGTGGATFRSGQGSLVTVNGGDISDNNGGAATIRGGDALFGSTGGNGGLLTGRGGSATGTNKNAGGVSLSTGDSSGTGYGRALVSCASSGTSGMGVTTASNRILVTGKRKALTDATLTTFALLSVATSEMVGCTVFFTVRGSGGGDFVAASGHFDACAVNKAGTVTTGVSAVTVTSSAVSGGATLTIAVAAPASTTNLALQINADSSITTTLDVEYTIIANGPTTITEQ